MPSGNPLLDRPPPTLHCAVSTGARFTALRVSSQFSISLISCNLLALSTPHAALSAAKVSARAPTAIDSKLPMPVTNLVAMSAKSRKVKDDRLLNFIPVYLNPKALLGVGVVILPPPEPIVAPPVCP